MGQDVTCCECGYFRGHPNKKDNKGYVTLFICSRCKRGINPQDEINEIEGGC